MRAALAARRVDDWLIDVGSLRPVSIDEAVITEAVAAPKDDVEGRG